jgi:multisite-specific tRNA:(cytosine-C5)-methyltransferase
LPYTFLKPNNPTLLSCIDQLSLIVSFPSSNILVSKPEGNAVYFFYLRDGFMKAVILNNDYIRMWLMKQETGWGVKVQFRVRGEGLPVVLPYIDPNVKLDAEFATLKTRLMTNHLLYASFSDPF